MKASESEANADCTAVSWGNISLHNWPTATDNELN